MPREGRWKSLPPAPPKRRGGCHARGAACGEIAMAVIQPYKRRRATPDARPAEKERELKGRKKKEMRYGREYC